MAGRGPRRQWWGLTWGQQREILRLVRRGHVHPDPALRDAAYRWAVEVRSDHPGRALIGGVFDSGLSWAERRAAHRILRAEAAAGAGAGADAPPTPEGS